MNTLPDDKLAWRTLARRLADQLKLSGAIRSDHWWSAFSNVPRHVFVPQFYTGPRACRRLVRPSEQSRQWLEEVYEDKALITRIDDRGVATSSSTEPSLMALMLEMLSVENYHRVLEIGTGTGYNAALLCHAVGASRVTTIEVDSELVSLATERLREIGYNPTVIAGDGGMGYLPDSPFDRILVTCSTWPLPIEWLEQLAIGGILACNVLNSLDGGLARINKTASGHASGRFVPHPAYFMSMHGDRIDQPPISELVQTVTQPTDDIRDVEIPPDLADDSFRLLASLYLQDVVWFGSPGAAGVEEFPSLVGLRDDSWASTTVADGHVRVAQYGDRRLWDIFESAYRQWTELGRPERTRYGISITPDRQWVWLDDPSSQHQWSLTNNACSAIPAATPSQATSGSRRAVPLD